MKETEREARRAIPEEADEEEGEQSADPGKLAALKANVERVTSTATLALEVAGIKTPTRPLGKKRLMLSGLLSLLFGPFGWFYAAPLKEAIPASLVYGVIVYVLSGTFLMLPLGAVVNVIAAIAGILYAWGFNSAGKRVPLLLKEKEGPEPPLRKLLSKPKKD
jgi:hypothetical protein